MTTTMTDNKADLATISEAAEVFAGTGYSLMTYSGRAMYGTQVVAVDVPRDGSPQEAVLLLAEQGDPKLLAFARTLTTSDSLGLGSVIYSKSPNATDEALAYVAELEDAED